MAARPMKESQLQISILQALRLACPKAQVYAVPLGGSRNPIEAANLKRQGVRAGVADLCVILPERVGFIEVKTARGRMSPAQQEFADLCKQYAIPHCIARSIDDAITAVRAWSAT
jgi:hypothetical protein